MTVNRIEKVKPSAYQESYDGRTPAQVFNEIIDAVNISGGDQTPSITPVYEVASIVQRDAIPNPRVGSLAFIADADGNGNRGISAYKGTYWTLPVVEGGAPGGSDTRLQSLGLNGTTLAASLSNGQVINVDLTGLPDEVNDADASPTNENQVFQLNNQTGEWSLSNAGGSGSLSNGIILSGNTLSIFGQTIDLSTYLDDTDDQTIGIVGTSLFIQNGNLVDLSRFINGVYEVNDLLERDSIQSPTAGSLAMIADADGLGNSGISAYNGVGWTAPIVGSGGPGGLDVRLQALSLTGTDLEANLSNGQTVNVDLSTLPVADRDNDPGNEIQLFNFDPTNGNWVLSTGGGTGTISAGVSYAGTNLTLFGQDIDLSTYLDDTDDQTINITGTNLSIQDGNTIDLSGLINNIYENVANLTALNNIVNPTAGSLAFIEDADGASNPGISGYNGSNWSVPLIVGASNGSDKQRYVAGSNVVVRASGPGVVATKSPGSITITVPSTVTLKSFRASGIASDLASGELRIIIIGGKGSGQDFNTSNFDLFHPTILIQNQTVILPSDPFLQRPDDAGDSINIFDEQFSANGQVACRISGLSGSWGIKGTL